MKIGTLAAVAALVLLAACADQPTVPRAAEPGETPGVITARFDCTASTRSDRVECVPAGASLSGGARGDLIVGSPYMKITTANVSYDSVTQIFRHTATVENRMGQAAGTTDGTTVAPTGIRVFFHTGPTVTSGYGIADVSNPDGIGFFTASYQPYFQYYVVLDSGEVSGAKWWEYYIEKTVVNFSFTLYVSAPVQFPNGWVDVGIPGTMPMTVSEQRQATATLRRATGVVESGTVTWSSSNPSVATVSSTGVVTAVAAGTAQITATSGARTGSATVTVS